MLLKKEFLYILFFFSRSTRLKYLPHYLLGHFAELVLKKKTKKIRTNYLKYITKKFLYTKNWFLSPLGVLDFYLKNKPKNILEIGTYEGLLAIWLYKKFPKAKITIVDPFLSDDKNLSQEDCQRFRIVEENFNKNISNLDKKKILFFKITSDLFFIKNQNLFDIIYIDGNHTPEQCYKDIENSYNVLSKNGLLIIDDIFLLDYKISPLDCLDVFLSKKNIKIKILSLNFQNIILQKIY